MESIEKPSEITFRYRIRKYRRINIPEEFPEIEEGDLYQVTLKKLKSNGIKYEENEISENLENDEQN